MTAATYARITDPIAEWGSAPALVFAPSAALLERGRSSVEYAGWRVVAAQPVEGAIERLDQQASTGLVWVELPGELGATELDLLQRIDGDVRATRYRALVAAPIDALDMISTVVRESAVELLIDAGDAERLAALALVASGAGTARNLSDIASDGSTARLRQLSDEVNRIASAWRACRAARRRKARPSRWRRATVLRWLPRRCG